MAAKWWDVNWLRGRSRPEVARITALPLAWQLLFEAWAVHTHPPLALAHFYCSPHQCSKCPPSFHVWDKTRHNLSLRFTSEEFHVLLFHLILLGPKFPAIHLMTSSFEIQCGNNYILGKKTLCCNILFILFMEDGGWVISADASVRKYLNVNSQEEKQESQNAKKKTPPRHCFYPPMSCLDHFLFLKWMSWSNGVLTDLVPVKVKVFRQTCLKIQRKSRVLADTPLV